MHGFQFHSFANDIQIDLTASSARPSIPDSLTSCIRDIKHWMSLNFLELNNYETEILMTGSATWVKIMDLSFDNDGICLTPSSTSIILAFYLTQLYFLLIFPQLLNSFFHLRNIACLRSSLTLADSYILIHALITSRQDYSNYLFADHPNKMYCKITVCLKFCSKSPHFHQTFCSHYSFTCWSSLVTGITYSLKVSASNI